MFFGSEPPLYLKPSARRGLRRHEADVLQHYPDYTHPLLPFPQSEAYVSETQRLHPTLTAAAELRHAQETSRARRQRILDARRLRCNEREAERQHQRQVEFEAAQQHAASIAGLSMRNEPGDGRDTVTRQYRSREAREFHQYNHAMEEHRYFTRQRRGVERSNPHGYNIITGQTLPPVVVPPKPVPPPETVFRFQ